MNAEPTGNGCAGWRQLWCLDCGQSTARWPTTLREALVLHFAQVHDGHRLCGLHGATGFWIDLSGAFWP